MAGENNSVYGILGKDIFQEGYVWSLGFFMRCFPPSAQPSFQFWAKSACPAWTATWLRLSVPSSWPLFLVGVVAAQGNLTHLSDAFSDKRGLLFIALSGIAGATSWLFYFMALKTGNVSQVAPIDKLSVVFAVILAVLIFGEKVSLVHGLAIGMIAVGGLILAIF